MLGVAERLRVMGSLALSLCHLAAGRVDELRLYIAPLLLVERARPLFDGLHIDAMTERMRLRTVDSRSVGSDLRLLLRPEPA